MADTDSARPKRLHERVESRLDVVVHGRQVRALNWSRGGMALPEDAVTEAVGARFSVEALFPVSGGILATPLTVEVAVRRAGRVGLRFVDLTDDQVTLLRRLVTGRRPEMTSRPSDPSSGTTATDAGSRGLFRMAMDRRIAIAMCAALVVAGSAALAAMRVLEPGDATYAAVARSERSLTAPTAGQVVEVLAKPGARVSPGTAILRLQAEGDVPLVLTAPCACTVTALSTTAGATVTSGSPLAAFGDPDAPPLVEALVDSAAAHGLTPGQTVSVVVAGQDGTFPGTILEAPAVVGSALPATLSDRPDLRRTWVAVDGLDRTVASGTPARVRFAGALERVVGGL